MTAPQLWPAHACFCPSTAYIRSMYPHLTSHATFHVFCPPTGAQGSVFGLPELGFRWSLGFSHPGWCLVVSDPLLTSFISVFVQVRLRYGFFLPIAAIYFSLEGFKGALSAACGRVANVPFLACLSSDLGGVWLFRIRCRRASFLPLSRLGCVTVFVHLLRPFTSP